MLKERIASLDEVPEALRGHYGRAEDGNGFEVQIEGAGPLRRVLMVERQAQKNLQRRVRELEEQVGAARGSPKREEMSPREQLLEDAAQRLAGLTGEARAAELAKIEQELAPLIEAEIADAGRPMRERLERLQSTIRRLTRENAAQDLIARIRRPGISTELLLPTVLARLEVQEQGGEFSAIGKSANGEPMGLEALAEELRATPALAPLMAGASTEEKAAHARRVAETLGTIKPSGAAL